MENILTPAKYCNSLTSYSRYITREIEIGRVNLGGNNPIRVQSMTTTDTMNTHATVEQSIRIIDAGADYVRITAPSINEAKNLENIKRELRKKGYNTPLIADIHFTPNAAELAARIVEKVRINPGNYADKKKFSVIDYTDNEYRNEIDRIREKFSPLVKICKEYGTAMRIGTNHGSLSDRIMSRFGDTPLGMVESALEFVRICEEFDYHSIVLSMKASNPKVMIEAYRLLVSKMEEEGMNYPLHLGVTEAGDGEDGRIKSAIGIGALLEDGIGDTVRVSLTEEPEFEIPVALNLTQRYSKRKNETEISPIVINPVNPFDYKRRETYEVSDIGHKNHPVVIISADELIYESVSGLNRLGYHYSELLDKWNIGEMAADYIYLGSKDISYKLPGTLKKIFNYNFWRNTQHKTDSYPLFETDEYLNSDLKSSRMNFVRICSDNFSEEIFNTLSAYDKAVLILESTNENLMQEMRRFIIELMNKDIKTPVILKRNFENIEEEKFILHASTDTGALLNDGIGDGIWLESSSSDLKKINTVSFGILQATRSRITRTEYISCPSCGRTLFDLQITTDMIRKRTDHLKGLKIAVMGCIVNGPGEMADADYGYVGSGPGRITLYKGREVVKRNISSDIAVDELIHLIKENGDWTEPSFL